MHRNIASAVSDVRAGTVWAGSALARSGLLPDPDTRSEQKHSRDNGSGFFDLGAEGGDFGDSVPTRVFDSGGGMFGSGAADPLFEFLGTRASLGSPALIEIDALTEAPAQVPLPLMMCGFASRVG